MSRDLLATTTSTSISIGVSAPYRDPRCRPPAAPIWTAVGLSADTYWCNHRTNTTPIGRIYVVCKVNAGVDLSVGQQVGYVR